MNQNSYKKFLQAAKTKYKVGKLYEFSSKNISNPTKNIEMILEIHPVKNNNNPPFITFSVLTSSGKIRYRSTVVHNIQPVGIHHVKK